jgi:hypothetical protein
MYKLLSALESILMITLFFMLLSIEAVLSSFTFYTIFGMGAFLEFPMLPHVIGFNGMFPRR